MSKITSFEQPNPHQKAIQQELDWLQQMLDYRLDHLESATLFDQLPDLELPPLDSQTHYGDFVQTQQFTEVERVLLALSLAKHLRPTLFLGLTHKYAALESRLLVGGLIDNELYEPTFQTLFFLLAGTHEFARQHFTLHFRTTHALFADNVIICQPPATTESETTKEKKQPLHVFTPYLNDPYLHYFLGAAAPTLDSDVGFPATRIATTKTFKDLVLPDAVIEKLRGAMDYIRNYQKLMEKPGTQGKIKPGYLMLLHGKPGTGKTLTSTVMGNYLGVEVYYLNLSRVVSKYIGETEKNFEKVFQRLEKKMCILFVDEADALFGKRTEVQDSKDRYANQEVAYLLQRVERFSGVVILATNYAENLDDAFTRRILAHIDIPLPQVRERTLLWQQSIPMSFAYEYEALPQQLGQEFALTGGNISNVIKQACLKAEEEGTHILRFSDHLEAFIAYEYQKEKRFYKKTLLEKIPDKVEQLTDTSLLGDLDEAQKVQAQFWHTNLPQGWQYAPDHLPIHLARMVRFQEKEIQQLLKAAYAQNHQSVAKVFNFSSLVPGFQALFKAMYPSQTLAEDAWQNLKMRIEQALIQAKVVPHQVENIQPSTAKAPSRVAREKNELSSSAQAGNDPWISGSQATELWQTHLPKGFEFSPRSLPKNLGRFYEVRATQVKKILVKACALAREQGTQEVGFTKHIEPFLKEIYQKENREFNWYTGFQ